MLNVFYHRTMGPYWPAERRYVVEKYRSLPFPFPEYPAPEVAMRACWDVDRFVGYLSTWSAVRQCASATGEDPLETLRPRLREHWGCDQREVRWPLYIRLGRVHAR